MVWISERISLPARPIEIARRLARRRNVSLVRVPESGLAFVACDPIERSTSLDPEPGLLRAPCVGGEAPRWLGLLPYEALRGLAGEVSAQDLRAPALVQTPLWFRYPALVRIGREVDVVGESAAAVRDLSRGLLSPPQASDVELDFAAAPEPETQHLERIRRALAAIARGEIYEVNLARRFELRVRGAPWDLLERIETAGSLPHAFLLESEEVSVTAASPELCLRLDAEGRVQTSPIKGTRPRHADPAEDRRLAEELERDLKERAELTMIIDVERNDLGRIAELGTVRVSTPPHVLSLPGIHHRLATVEAQVSAQVSRLELFSAMLPSGSVTGAPKRRAMQLIAELEPNRRGLYTGVVGFVRQDGGLELKMAIRTLCARAGVGHYHSGGGIVADSSPEREVEETLWKAERIIALAGQRRA
jgi:anthranilate/para-aminobenzoate synthase component I